MIPREWKKYPVPSSTSINIWIVDLGARIKQLQQIKSSNNFLRDNIWIGGLFSAEAFMTATRQAAAQVKHLNCLVC
jgi:dynein heavy chain 1